MSGVKICSLSAFVTVNYGYFTNSKQPKSQNRKCFLENLKILQVQLKIQSLTEDVSMIEKLQV